MSLIGYVSTHEWVASENIRIIPTVVSSVKEIELVLNSSPLVYKKISNQMLKIPSGLEEILVYSIEDVICFQYVNKTDSIYLEKVIAQIIKSSGYKQIFNQNYNKDVKSIISNALSTKSFIKLQSSKQLKNVAVNKTYVFDQIYFIDEFYSIFERNGYKLKRREKNASFRSGNEELNTFEDGMNNVIVNYISYIPNSGIDKAMNLIRAEYESAKQQLSVKLMKEKLLKSGYIIESEYQDEENTICLTVKI